MGCSIAPSAELATNIRLQLKVEAQEVTARLLALQGAGFRVPEAAATPAGPTARGLQETAGARAAGGAAAEGRVGTEVLIVLEPDMDAALYKYTYHADRSIRLRVPGDMLEPFVGCRMTALEQVNTWPLAYCIGTNNTSWTCTYDVLYVF